jgi:hypothetical protein
VEVSSRFALMVAQHALGGSDPLHPPRILFRMSRNRLQCSTVMDYLSSLHRVQLSDFSVTLPTPCVNTLNPGEHSSLAISFVAPGLSPPLPASVPGSIFEIIHRKYNILLCICQEKLLLNLLGMGCGSLGWAVVQWTLVSEGRGRKTRNSTLSQGAQEQRVSLPVGTGQGSLEKLDSKKLSSKPRDLY